MARFCSGVAEDISHITRKKAIMAVAKSAKAIFQAPPWWPPPTTFLTRLTRIGWLFSIAQRLASVATHGLLEFDETRPVRRQQHLAAELHGQGRRHAGSGSDQRGLDRLVEVQLLLGVVPQRGSQGGKETVGREN